jgi:phage N-6-adenine-methyltransferase
MTVAQDKTSVGAGSMEWRTPPELFAWLNRRFQFNTDVFASHENALCDYYSTAAGSFMKTNGDPICVSLANGLEMGWENARVFMNPPYSRGLIEQCIEKAYNERNNAAIIVALIPASTETQWFQKFILPHCHIEWLPRRVRFIDPETGEPGQSPPSGSVIAIFRQDYK